MAVLCLLRPAPGRADELIEQLAGLALQRHQPALGGTGSLLLDGVEVSPLGTFSAGFMLSYSARPLQLGAEEQVFVPVPHLVGGHLALGVGLDRASIELGLPVSFYPGTFDDSPVTLSGGAVGDLRINGRLRIQGPALGRPGFGLLVSAQLPTGAPARLSGEGAPHATLMAVFEARGRRLRFLAHAGGRLRPEQALLDHLQGSEIVLRAALEVGLGPTLIRAELDSWLAPRAVGGYAGGEWMLSGELPLLAGLSLLAGAGSGIGAAPGVPRLRISAGVRWADPRGGGRDRDRDGITDLRDDCPGLQEDFDGRDDADGCPEFDDDADGVPDERDACPLVPEDLDGVEDEDGCPEGLRPADSDGDGWADADDPCVRQPEDFLRGSALDGCPSEPDSWRGRPGDPGLIRFAAGETNLPASAGAELDRIAQELRARPWLELTVLAWRAREAAGPLRAGPLRAGGEAAARTRAIMAELERRGIERTRLSSRISPWPPALLVGLPGAPQDSHTVWLLIAD